MIIAITSDGNNLHSRVAEKFTTAQFIIFYNKDIEKFEAFRNPHSAVFGGAGIQTAQLIIENNATAVIACDIGLNAFRMLQSANVKIYPCQQSSVIEAINDFASGKISELKRESKE